MSKLRTGSITAKVGCSSIASVATAMISSCDIAIFEGTCDHRRAEIIHQQLWDKVPASAWKNVG
ncbi:Hha/YmoA family nucleoid-associated regulatory protein [Pluralibacter gergoviae]|uniref:Hha/YmoA family nucleoid-associated regulatory protein n=1 Tax=Pluralibacter gergoviae TaxID=61647 RepID=UPI003EE2A428